MILTLKNIYEYITDQDIFEAEYFDGWISDYSSIGKWPITNLNKNAYHIKYLASRMLYFGKWIGEPIYLPTLVDHVHNGQHRLRAISYLKNIINFNIEIPYVISQSAYLCNKTAEECFKEYLK